jgi:hypothetical protein
MDGAVVGARPEYYGLLLFSLLGQGEMPTTSVSASGLNVTAYSVRARSGSINVLLVNKDPTQNVQASIHCGQAVKQATLLQMTGPTLSATNGVTIQGASVNVDGSFAPGTPYAASEVSSEVVSCYVPSLSAVLVQLS